MAEQALEIRLEDNEPFLVGDWVEEIIVSHELLEECDNEYMYFDEGDGLLAFSLGNGAATYERIERDVRGFPQDRFRLLEIYG